VSDQLQALLLDELGQAGRVDPERVSEDSFGPRAVNGGPDRANPTDRGEQGSTLHLLALGNRWTNQSARLPAS
jgi:hypothetical protein